MAEWGTVYHVPGMEKAPEFNYYSTKNYANIEDSSFMQLNITQVAAIMDP